MIDELGENDWLKSNGVMLRKRWGPWALGYLAARRSKNTNGNLHENWG